MSCRSYLFAICIAVVLAVPLACVPSGDGNSSNDGGSLNIGEANSSNPANSSLPSGSVSSRIADVFGAYFEMENQNAEVECECSYEEAGYESEQACVDARTTSQSTIDELAGCMEDAAAEHASENTPPDGVSAVLDCMEPPLDAIQNCASTAESAAGERCTQNFMSEYAQCVEDNEAQVQACNGNLDEEADQWFEGLNDALDEAECFGGAGGGEVEPTNDESG